MAERAFTDPTLELAHRLGGDAGDVFDLATEVTNEEAEVALSVLDEVEAELAASELVSRLRRQGHTL